LIFYPNKQNANKNYFAIKNAKSKESMVKPKPSKPKPRQLMILTKSTKFFTIRALKTLYFLF